MKTAYAIVNVSDAFMRDQPAAFRSVVRRGLRDQIAKFGEVERIWRVMIDPVERHDHFPFTPYPPRYDGQHVVVMVASLR